MSISPDFLSAAASIVSSVVVIFTALAAFRQIAHMRSANEIQAFSARWVKVDEPRLARRLELMPDSTHPIDPSSRLSR
jgi:hypothetical protein